MIAAEARAPGLSVDEYLQSLLPQPNGIDLTTCGIDETQAADLRARVKTFAEDWDRPEANIYDENPPRETYIPSP